MELIITAAAIALVIYVLERSNRRSQLGHRLAGSTDIIDRDKERITAELRTR